MWLILRSTLYHGAFLDRRRLLFRFIVSGQRIGRIAGGIWPRGGARERGNLIGVADLSLIAL
jgi:hypothetical protein